MTTTATGPSLDDLTPHQLVDEIKQIVEQYSREVTTSRRTWPKSVRERVLALARLGVPRNRIAKLCALPSTTVFLWCRSVSGKKLRPEPRFLALPARSEVSHSNITVGMEWESKAGVPIPTVATGLQILLPGGIEVRGLTSVEQVLALYRGCRA
jgi:hypothetical protein